jgi:hypothetical protein
MDILLYSLLLIIVFTTYMNWNSIVDKIKKRKIKNEIEEETGIQKNENISKRKLRGNPRENK